MSCFLLRNLFLLLVGRIMFGMIVRLRLLWVVFMSWIFGCIRMLLMFCVENVKL